MASPSETMQAFYGKIARAEAETFLGGKKEGVHLLRVSTSDSVGNYVLSLVSGGIPLHFQVKNQGECWFAIDDGPMFEGLHGIMRYYARETDGLPTTLTTPMDRKSRTRDQEASNNTLHTQCLAGNVGKIASLVSKGGDVNARNRCGRTALHEAARGGNGATVTELVRHGSRRNLELDAIDDLHWTPLHLAAYNGNTEAVQALIEAKASPHSKTTDNETPLAVAARMGKVEAARLLGMAENSITRAEQISWRLQPWMHGRLPRKVAEHVLSLNGNGNGLFLVRESSQSATDYVLSVCFDGKPWHFQIQSYRGSKENCFFIDDGPVFQGLVQVIEYYRTQPDGLPTQLRQFCKLGSAGAAQALASLGSAPVPVPRGAGEGKRSTGGGGGGGGSAAGGDEGSDSSDDDADDYNHMSQFDSRGGGGGGGTSMIAAKDIVKGKKLGEGEFGEVIQGIWKTGGKKIPVAIKTLRVGEEMPASAQEEFLKEATVMQNLQHVYVVRLYGIVIEGTKMIVQELVELGALQSYLTDHTAALKRDPDVMTLYGAQIAVGMEYLEKQKFVHRDLATRNILLSNKELCKIADFGLSRKAQEENDYYTASAGGKWPVKWYAPESVYYGKFTSKSDVWSFGVCLWEIFEFAELPYGDMSGREVLEKIETGYRLPQPTHCPPGVYKVMHMCWEYEKAERAPFSLLKGELHKLLTSKRQKKVDLR